MVHTIFRKESFCAKSFVTMMALLVSTTFFAQQVDYSVVSVPEESGLEFIKITSDNDYVCLPMVKRTAGNIEWLTNRILGVSTDNSQLAFLSAHNNTSNIFVKQIDGRGASVKRTNRSGIIDFSYSPDGNFFCFSEQVGETNIIFQTNATSGFVCKQITSGSQDYSPIYSSDMKQIFFARQESNGISIWSYDTEKNFLSSYVSGFNPCPLPDESAILCTRSNSMGLNEIWKINFQTGSEECIISDTQRSFTSPTISPDGKWILCVGSSRINGPGFTYQDTDLFVCRLDGSDFTQLTYHAADDLSPVWSRDGRYIYFISQRGNAAGIANIWRISFLLN